jgi:hypothetical protein
MVDGRCSFRKDDSVRFFRYTHSVETVLSREKFFLINISAVEQGNLEMLRRFTGAAEAARAAGNHPVRREGDPRVGAAD